MPIIARGSLSLLKTIIDIVSPDSSPFNVSGYCPVRTDHVNTAIRSSAHMTDNSIILFR